MALKSVGTQFQTFKKGEKVEGYLLTVGEQEFPPKTPGGKPSLVPTVVIQDETGKRHKRLLGAAVREDVNLLAVGVWTVITKAKETRETRAGNQICEYDLQQDTDRVLRGS